MPDAPDTPAPARRSQDERKTATRAALLAATIETLVELGYARTTTTEVTRRAGVSQGALFKHFPTKSALVAAATEELFESLVERFGAAFTRERSGGGEPIVVAIQRLWEVFCHPSLRAVYLLYAEAPSDPELTATLRPVVLRHATRLADFAVALFPEIGATAENRAVFDTILFAMQGASLQRCALADDARERAMIAHFERLARSLVAPAQIPNKKPRARAS